MKNTALFLAILAMVTTHAPSLRADSSEPAVEVAQETPAVDTAPTVVDEEDYDEPQGAEVSAATTNKEETSKKRQLTKNLLLAGAALVVAVISMLIVSNNNGKKQ